MKTNDIDEYIKSLSLSQKIMKCVEAEAVVDRAETMCYIWERVAEVELKCKKSTTASYATTH